MSSVFALTQYGKFLLTSKTKYYIHSPYVYQLCEEVIYNPRNYYAFYEIEYLRKKMLESEQIIQVTDYGAGSHTATLHKPQRTIAHIVKHVTITPKKARLLFKLTHFLKPKTIIEMGTSLGISTLYMHQACPNATLHTLEGCPNIANVAHQNFEAMHANRNIIQHIGNFDQTLPALLQTLTNNNQALDLAFMDGNHQYEPTMQYFEQLLPYCQPHSALVFDDIYWSKDMQKAWQHIQKHPKVTLTLNLFWLGIVFFRTEQASKEHFKLYFF